MKKNSITISISYNQAVTPDSIDNTIAQEIHQIESASEAIETMRETLCAFIKDNREAIDVAEVTATLKANGYAKQRISELLQSYGITRRAKSKSRAEASEKIDAMLPKAEAALLKLVGGDKKLYRAVVARLFRK
jgi:hypothetical protein